MSSPKIRAAAKRWAHKWLKPVDRMTPDEINSRIQLAYMDGVERGRRDQRNHDKSAKRSRGNNGHVRGCVCVVCE